MLCKQVSLPIVALLGKLERVCLSGFFREKKNYMLVLFLEPEDIKILSPGASWNFSKGTGLS
jgi:hypothetical protein